MSVSVKRVERYLTARKKLRQLDRAWIHWINQGAELEAELRTEDIVSLLEQRTELLEALKDMCALYNTDEGTRSLPQYVAAVQAISKAEAD